MLKDDVELEQQDILSSEDNQQEAQTAVYTPPAVVEEEEESAQQIFTVVEEMPKFPGGDAELLKFIAKSNQVSGNRTGKRYPRSCNLRIRG